jgi:hypothetical protein
MLFSIQIVLTAVILIYFPAHPPESPSYSEEYKRRKLEEGRKDVGDNVLNLNAMYEKLISDFDGREKVDGGEGENGMLWLLCSINDGNINDNANNNNIEDSSNGDVDSRGDNTGTDINGGGNKNTDNNNNISSNKNNSSNKNISDKKEDNVIIEKKDFKDIKIVSPLSSFSAFKNSLMPLLRDLKYLLNKNFIVLFLYMIFFGGGVGAWNCNSVFFFTVLNFRCVERR